MIPGSSIQELLWDLFSTNLLPTVLIIQISLVKIIKNAPWRILVPRAVACDNLHLRASVQKRALELVLRPFFNCTETVSLLLLCNVLSDIECNRNYDNDTLCNVLVVCINTQIL